MSLTTVLAAVAAMAVNFGWQKADDGYEYLVQLEPETLQLLHEGIDVPIDSHVPEGVQPIRRVRIVVGKAELPREELSATDGPRTDTAVERSANWRPGDTAPPADGRYPTPPPAAAPQSTIDTLAQPLRNADNFFEQGFEKGLDGLENAGQAVRGAVNDLGTGVQDHLKRSKEMLVGPAPNYAFPAASSGTTLPAATGAAPDLGAAPSWQNMTSAPTNGSESSMRGLPPPPLAGAESPAAAVATNTDPAGDNWPRFPAAPGATDPMTGTENGSRMVAVEPVNADTTAPRVPAWDPKWPVATTQPASSPSGSWPDPITPAPATSSPSTAQPVAITGGGSSQTPTQAPAVSDSASASVQSLGGWAVAIIGLAGSVGCNFFLGFSYLDIRNKYRAALRRTSRSFGRPVASA